LLNLSCAWNFIKDICLAKTVLDFFFFSAIPKAIWKTRLKSFFGLPKGPWIVHLRGSSGLFYFGWVFSLQSWCCVCLAFCLQAPSSTKKKDTGVARADIWSSFCLVTFGLLAVVLQRSSPIPWVEIEVRNLLFFCLPKCAFGLCVCFFKLLYLWAVEKLVSFQASSSGFWQ